MSDAPALMPFAALLRRRRLAAGLTQEELAERAGMSPRGLVYLERGTRQPYRDTVRRLAEALGLAGEERAQFEAAGNRLLEQAAAERSVVVVSQQESAAPPHNLPAAVSPLIGREQEQRRVRELLAEARLVTLTGSGGVGKTRLALAVAEQLSGGYADGVWLVELGPLGDLALVPGEVARTLGLHEESERSHLEALTGYLRGKRALLVLDNCEHLIAACAALAIALLRACPALRILATSQGLLGVVGERRYRVPSLSAPDPRRLPSLDVMGRYEAVQLFMTRSRERCDDFTLTATNARAIAEICARLDGIPLALELAAARVGSMLVETIADRLDNRFALLTTGARTALPRQQTLRATLEWSYDLLTVSEQTLLRRLAVFAGGASLEAAEAICADPSPQAHASGERFWGGATIGGQKVLDLLDALVQRSLAQAELGRYSVLETIRAYAHVCLLTLGEEDAVRWRHARYYLGVAETIRPELTGPEQRRWLARLEVEHDNLRAAMRWAHERGDGALALGLAAALWRFWYLHGHLSEGRASLERALELAVDEPPADAGSRANACHGAGVLAWTQGDEARAMVLAEQALALWRTAERPGSGEGRDTRAAVAASGSLNLLGLIAIDQGNWDRAAAALEESLALRRTLQDRWGIATALHNLGTVARGRGDHAGATALYAESLALRMALADEAGIAISYRDQAALAMEQGDEARAQTLYRQSMRHAAALGDLVGLAQCLDGLAAIAAVEGRAPPAAQLCGAAAALREQVGASVARTERAGRQRLLEALRESLGATFDVEQAAGREIPWEELIARLSEE
jgi:non-specific serine/threonine protein kinase